MTGDLKEFVDKYGFDVLVILASYLSEEDQEKRQIAVYSENMELGNQICCELEECQNPCLELDPLEYGCDQLLLYHQANSTANCGEIFLLMKDVITKRHPEMASNSRTSSTEAVAGSAPLSQGSSGIVELYGSDIEPQSNVVNFIENPQDHNGSAQAHADINVDLVSPDSGLATIRSSRSSKESSVFLSDDSPVAEGAVSHHSFLSGFDSYSPIPEGAVAEEKPQSRNSSDNFDFFNFDLAPMTTVQTEASHSVDCSPGDDFSHDSGSSEGQQPAGSKIADGTNPSEYEISYYSADLPVTRNGEDDTVKFNEHEHQPENTRDFAKSKSSLIALENDSPPSSEVVKSDERRTPPTPMNSLVDTSPLDSGPPLFYPQDVIKKINEIDHVNHPQSRVRYGSWWDGFELGSKDADTWSSAETEGVFQNPDSWKGHKGSLLLTKQTDRRASDSVCVQKQPKHLEFSGTGIWEDQLSPIQNEHALGNQEKENGQQKEDFSNMWKSNRPMPEKSDPWDNTNCHTGCVKTNSPTVWSKLDCDDSELSEDVWKVPHVDFDHISQRNFDTWAVSKHLPELSGESECENLNNQVDLRSRNKDNHSSIDNHRPYTNEQPHITNMQKNVKLTLEHQNDPVENSKQNDIMEGWGVSDSNIRKEILGNLVSWEDPFLSYRDPDFITSNICEDLVVSPPDTNYSTSDSYVSPSGTGDEREGEGKLSNGEPIFDQMINSNPGEHEICALTEEKPFPQSSPIRSSDSSCENRGPEKETEPAHSRVNLATNTVFLDSEQKGATYFSDDYCVDESSPSTSENYGLIMISVQTSNPSLTSKENAEITSGDSFMDTDFLHLDTNDMKSTISVSSKVKDNEQSQQSNKLLDKHFNQWNQQLQCSQQPGLEHSDVSSASVQRVKECERSNDKRSGHDTLNNIKNVYTQNDDTLPSSFLALSYINNSDETMTMSDNPRSFEKPRSSGSLEDVGEPSEISIQFPNWTNSVNEDKKEESPDSNADCFAVSPRDGNTFLVHPDTADHSKYSLNVASTSVLKCFDNDFASQKTLEWESPSLGSVGKENSQEKLSAIFVDNQGQWDKLLSSHETSLEDISQEKATEIPQNPYREYTKSMDTKEAPIISNSLSYEMDYSERGEASESLESENKGSNKTYIDIIPHHELSQILDAWSISVNEQVHSVVVSPKIKEALGESDTTCSFPEDIEVKDTYNDGNTCDDSIHEYTRSSATSPDFNDSSTNIHTWDSLQVANNEKENKDNWDITNYGKSEACEKELLENKSQEDSETSTDHKVPKNLDLWNAHIEDDTVSSLSSPGIDEDSEYSNVHQSGEKSDVNPDKLEEDIIMQESLYSHETNLTVNSESSGAQPSLDQNIHEMALNTCFEEGDACSTLRQDYCHEPSEYLGHWRTTQDKVHDQISNINHEQNYASRTSDVWDLLLHSNSESSLDKFHMSRVEDLGFSNDSSEWWNLQKPDDNSVGQECNSSYGLKINVAVAVCHDVLGVVKEGSDKLEELNAASYEKESTQLNSKGEHNNGEHSLDKQKEELDQVPVNFEECDSLSQSYNNKEDENKELFAASISDQACLNQCIQEDWQSSLFSALAQVDPKLGQLRDHLNVAPSDPNEINIGNPFDQKLLDSHEESSPNTPQRLAARTSSSTCNEDRVPQEKTFVPDILKNNPADCQGFTIDPDLWNVVEQPFNLRTNRENPDILSHCDQDSSSQASSSPDVCHEYESKQTCAQSSVLPEPKVATHMSPMLSDMYKDTDFYFNQQLMIDREEICPEGNCSCLPDNYDASIEESYQLSPNRKEESFEIRMVNIEISDTVNKTTFEIEDLSSSGTESVETAPLNLDKGIFGNKNIDEEEVSASVNKSIHPTAASVMPTDGSACCTFTEDNQLFGFDYITGNVDQQKASNIHVNSEVVIDHCKIAITNGPSTIVNETNPLTILDNESEVSAEAHRTPTQMHSLKASLEEEKEDFLYGTGSQYAINTMQEPENRQESPSPCFTGSPDRQSPYACTSPFDVAFGTEYTNKKGDMEISESDIMDIKAESSQGDQGWGSLLVESDGTPGSSCTLKRFEYETDSSNIESPTGDSEINISESKDTAVKGEVAEHIQEDQGWSSLLLESDEHSNVLKEFDHGTDSSNIDSQVGKGEINHSEAGHSEANSKAGDYSQEDQDWASLLLESEITPMPSDSLKEFEYEAEPIHKSSPAGGVVCMGNETVCDMLSNDGKGYKSTERAEMTNKESKEDTVLNEVEDQSSLEMDYVLISGEENVPLRKDILVTRESHFTSQETTAVAEQTDSLETFSPDSSDTFQSISIINESEGQSTLETEWDSFYLGEKPSAVVSQKLEDEKKPSRSPVQDQEWTMVGQNRGDDVSSEENYSRTDTMQLLCGNPVKELEDVLIQDLISETQVEILLDRNPHKLLVEEHEISYNGRTDALLFQAEDGNGDLEAHSQHPKASMVTEQEMDQETQFADNEKESGDITGLVSEDEGMDTPFSEAVLDSSATEMRPEPPNSLDLDGSNPRRIKLTAPNINLSLDQSEGSVLSDDNLDTPDEIDINVDDLETPDEADSFDYTGHEEQPAIKEISQEASESIPEYTAEEEREDNRLWRTVVIGDQEQRIDMKAIEPYKKVISHGGYYGDGLNAIIVFAACFLPDSSQTDYHYVMENLFLYVISTLELMVAEDYMVVYLNGATPRRRMPGLGWMKRCYQMIDRRLRKNLKSFIIVHPSWFIRTILAVTRPFISSKFSSKIQYVSTLAELSELIPMEYVNVPESIVKYDEDRSFQRRVRLDEELREASANIDMKLKGNS